MQNYGSMVTGMAPSPMGASNSRVTASLSALGRTASASGSPSPATSSSAYNGPYANQSLLGQPISIWVGLVALLGLFKFLSEHKDTKINPAHVHIGGYNVAAIGVVSVVFIVAFKAAANRWPLPGVTDVANFV